MLEQQSPQRVSAGEPQLSPDPLLDAVVAVERGSNHLWRQRLLVAGLDVTDEVEEVTWALIGSLPQQSPQLSPKP